MSLRYKDKLALPAFRFLFFIICGFGLSAVSGCQELVIGEGVVLTEERPQGEKRAEFIVIKSELEGEYKIDDVAYNEAQMLSELQALKQKSKLEYIVTFHLSSELGVNASQPLSEKLKTIGISQVIFVY